ncbi:hypothetical protein S7711_01711 [Stachybotrys chartarum IBT 7711]|uniref:Phosphoinositide phospholipase C n=1 Tax=Stachybotrys chartarum (strain CBS 109288 / IBT 7711) TaxID=1280523 RepID=A0A084AVD1_STACB|nr:hypothetical protein S7711_01711 [Stachybotrys chartarum IBT 7711]
MSFLKDKLANLNPFARDSDDDKGEEIDQDTDGLQIHPSKVAKDQLQVSSAIKSFLVHEGLLSQDDAGPESSHALRALLRKPFVVTPHELLDPSHPLPEYYMSSSHNTYLLAHQLFGTSCASGYEIALRTGSRCVEIDAWDDDDNKDEPKVTHGFTLVSHIPFRAVCETIAREFDQEEAQIAAVPGVNHSPIFLSLENHCDAHGQLRLVEIMKEVFGHRLLSKAVRQEGHREQQGSGEHVTLSEMGPCIAVIVEYHLPEEESDSDSSSSEDDSSDDDVKEARKTYKKNKKNEPHIGIIPELAALGVYAQSVKPKNTTWFSSDRLTDGPHHHLINISESGLSSHMPTENSKIAIHNAHHLMRVFPKGLRISSSNLLPLRFWAIGAQICALNWQTFGLSMQLNRALFYGTNGYVLKPAGLRSGGDGRLGSGEKKRLRLHIAGASSIPLHEGEDPNEIRPYLTCSLFQPDQPEAKRKTKPYKSRAPSFAHDGDDPAPMDALWEDVLEWEYEDNELTFLRMLIKSDESWSKNPKFAVLTVRLQYVQPGWRFVRMFDLRGRESLSTMLVKFEITTI